MNFRLNTRELATVTVAISVATVGTASAATWDGPNNGDYATAVNWNPDGVPVSGDSYINGGLTAIYSTAGNITSTGRLLLGLSSAGTLTMQGSAGTLSFAGSPFNGANYIGVDGNTGAVNANAGILAFTGMTNGAGHLHIGANGGVSNGTLNIGGGTVNVGTRVTMGVGYPGSDAINTVGNGGNGNATITISSGSLNIGTSSVTDTDKGALYMKSPTGGSGTATVNLDGGSLSLTRFILGADGTNSKILNFNGGTLIANASATNFLSAASGFTANVKNGGAVIDTQAFNITVGAALVASGTGGLTKSGTGTLTLSGANTYTGATVISGGTLQISGSGSLTAGNYNPAITMSNNATLQYSSSANQTLGGLISGAGGLTKDTGGSSTLTLSNGASSYTGNISITSGTLLATGTTGGTNPTTGSLGNTQTASRTITIGTGAALRFGNNDILGNHTSTPVVKLVVNGGTITNGNFFATLGAVDLNGGTINSTGGVNAAFPSFSLRGPITVGGSAASTISGSGANSQMVVGGNTAGTQTTFDVANATGDALADLTVSVPLQNNRNAGFAEVATGIIKTGVGTMTLSAVNTYTGATTASNGTLVINGNISTSSLTTVNSGATLKGTGTVGTASISGLLAPGNSIGTLNFSNTLSLSGIADFEIDPTLSLGLNADLANVTNGVTYGGTLNVLYGGSSSNFANGMVFNLFDASSFSGFFGTVNLPSLTGGLTWQNDLATNGTLSVIPEPSVAALLGGLGLLALRRRRQGNAL